MADRILMLNGGRIVRAGAPAEIWKMPGSAWVARFLDVGNVIEGTIRVQDGKMQAETAAGRIELDCTASHQTGEKVDVLVRPQGSVRSSNGPLRSRVTDVVFQQDRYKVTLANGLYFYLEDTPEVGEEIRLEVPPSAVQCLS